MNYC